MGTNRTGSKVKRMVVVSLGILCGVAQGQNLSPDREVVYSQRDARGMKLYVYQPQDWQENDVRPAIVFFYGGGWKSGGGPNQFRSFCRHLTDRGMVAFCADYRTEESGGAVPFQCLEDAKTAMRYLRSHADEFGIDSQKLAAGGGSAGGHLAAALSVVDQFNHPEDDLAVSCRPDALVLCNPVYDNGPGGYGYDRVSAYWQDFSPMEHVNEDMAPAIVFLGTEDHLVPVATARKFQEKMKTAGVRSELVLFDGQGHGFFNNSEFHNCIFSAMDRFLESLGYFQKSK